MKAVVLLVLLVVALAFVPEASGWGRIFRRAVRGIKRGIRKIRIPVRTRRIIRRVLGKRDADLSDDEILKHLATRDVSELVDINKITDAQLAELLTAKRESRAVLDELDAADSEEHHELS